MENPETCEWNEINRLKSPNRFKRTTFSSKPVVLVIFRLGQPKICVPIYFLSGITGIFMSMVNNQCPQYTLNNVLLNFIEHMKKWGGQLDIRSPQSKNWRGRVPLPIPPRIDAPGLY